MLVHAKNIVASEYVSATTARKRPLDDPSNKPWAMVLTLEPNGPHGLASVNPTSNLRLE